jgi:hypothetical protein
MNRIRLPHPAILLLLPLALSCGQADSEKQEGGEANSSSAITSAAEVIARAAENWGGTERLQTLTTLRAAFTYDEADGPVTHDIGRPDQVRSTGGERYISVFDGHQAAFLRYVDRDGNNRDPFLVEGDEVKDWELEKAWVFPAFFDHPAEYLGLETIGGSDLHVLRVNLPLGARIDYLLDAESFLVIRAEGLARIGETTFKSGREYSDFQEFDGILYPTRMTYFYGDGEPQPGTIGSVEFNVAFPADHFVIPEALR